MSKTVAWSEDTFGDGSIVCECDNCGEVYEFEFTDKDVDFTTCQSDLKLNGWLSRKIDGEWYDFCCEECYKKFLSQRNKPKQDSNVNNPSASKLGTEKKEKQKISYIDFKFESGNQMVIIEGELSNEEAEKIKLQIKNDIIDDSSAEAVTLLIKEIMKSLNRKFKFITPKNTFNI